MKRLFDRAKEAKCSALVITVDLQIMGQRHKDIKNGLSAPPKLTPASILNLATKVTRGGWRCSRPSAASSATWWAMPRACPTRVAGLMDGGGLRPVAQLGPHQGVPQAVGTAR
jgi:isopentenyl diphosphate isomerase/L-lactate dehydrogenase-like FMN-dependent dehydrogenase